MRYLGAAVTILALSGAAGAELATKTVDRVCGEAVHGSSMTDRQAKQAALDDARALAVEQAAGVEVRSAGQYQSSLERVHFLLTLSKGYIVREEILERTVEPYQRRVQDAPVLKHRACIRAEVAVLPQASDPGFGVEATLNRTAFEEGDEAVLEISARRPSWVYVFNLRADDKASLLFPNRWQMENRVEAGKKLLFPAKDCGVRLEMRPLPGDPESAEAFLVVAFPEKKSIAERIVPEKQYALSEFYNHLTAFPLGTAAVKMVPYTVKARPR